MNKNSIKLFKQYQNDESNFTVARWMFYLPRIDSITPNLVKINLDLLSQALPSSSSVTSCQMKMLGLDGETQSTKWESNIEEEIQQWLNLNKNKIVKATSLQFIFDYSGCISFQENNNTNISLEIRDLLKINFTLNVDKRLETIIFIDIIPQVFTDKVFSYKNVDQVNGSFELTTIKFNSAAKSNRDLMNKSIRKFHELFQPVDVDIDSEYIFHLNEFGFPENVVGRLGGY